MRLTIAHTVNAWSNEGPNTVCSNVEISREGIVSHFRGPLTQGSSVANVSFETLKALLLLCRHGVVEINAETALRASHYGTLITISAQLDNGTSVIFYSLGKIAYRDNRNDICDARNSGLVALIINFIESAHMPFELIEDYITEKVIKK
jgi:hypothetical protein